MPRMLHSITSSPHFIDQKAKTANAWLFTTISLNRKHSRMYRYGKSRPSYYGLPIASILCKAQISPSMVSTSTSSRYFHGPQTMTIDIQEKQTSAGQPFN